ncbi:GtrA family protein [Pseudoduganella flava]|nr:GtrA family protein [Pseudoduganella flava]
MAVHYVVVTSLLRFVAVPGRPAVLHANVLGFLCAFPVSYLGHRHATFAATGVPHHLAMRRFFATAVLGFLVNEGLLALLVTATRLDYRAALVIVLGTVAALTFVLARCWAFAAGQAP